MNFQTSVRHAVRPVLKRVPGVQRLRDVAPMRHSELQSKLELFVPNSAGRPAERTFLTLQSAGAAFHTLDAYLERFAQDGPRVTTSTAFGADSAASAARLEALFNQHHSDKSRDHDYHFVYATVLDDLGDVRNLLEVGLGTNFEDVVSNMSSAGSPGASLRAFRDYLPEARVFGADIDRRVLFSEERIETFFVDQTDLSTVDDLAARFTDGLDLVIDDGLHSPDANMNIVNLARQALRPGGWVVVEDIAATALPFWRVVSHLVGGDFDSATLIEARGAWMWAARRHAG